MTVWRNRLSNHTEVSIRRDALLNAAMVFTPPSAAVEEFNIFYGMDFAVPEGMVFK